MHLQIQTARNGGRLLALSLLLGGAIGGGPLTSARAELGEPAAARLSLDQARYYMLELINRDRATHGLRPVALDPVASEAGQRHAQEMASHRYLAHWNIAGESPQQRYARAGGREAVAENAYLLQGSYGGTSPRRLDLDPTPYFSRYELERIERSYMSEAPPNDGHRRNILDPSHTHVGIALAKAGDSNAYTVTNTQEFVDRNFSPDPSQGCTEPETYGTATEDREGESLDRCVESPELVALSPDHLPILAWAD